MADSEDAQGNTIVGVDVGGTFTDLVALSPSGLRLAKVPSTIDNQSKGVLSALKAADCDIAALDLIVHGTTTTTNAVLERKLARTGLITTQGFRDILELGRRTRPQAYGMFGEFKPLIPRDLRLEVPERMDCDGNIITPLDNNAVANAARSLLDRGCEAVVVHFLHAYANPTHEQQAVEVIQSLWPNNYITAGHALLSENREYERGVTAAVNASVQPVLSKYVDRLVRALTDKGYTRDLLIMNGNGGMVRAQHVAKEAAKTVMSGPASGVMAAAFTGRMCSEPNLITYDMGGTSTDVALIRDATPSVSNEIEVEYGLPIHVPMVDVRTVGAGGGSIARINSGGLLEVGPESAGASPGPICYGRGGTEPTISDANFLLGRLRPPNFSGTDESKISRNVRGVMTGQLASALNCSAVEAAAAVVRIANAKMAGAIRMVSLSLGADPRDFALFAFGGAGPLHAADLARELDIPRVVIPARPGLTNALGCVVADLRYDFVRTLNIPLSTLGPNQIASVFSAQIEQGKSMVSKETVTLDRIESILSLDMQFTGQTHLLRVPIDNPAITNAELQSLFERIYFERFHVELPNIQATVVNVNCSIVGHRPPLDLSQLLDRKARAVNLREAQTSTRPVFFDTTWIETPVFSRDAMPAHVSFYGPAILEQMDTTIVVPPGDRVTSDKVGNLILHVGGAL
ncbi:hydantoinase/oxoprolinase family protein [Shimia sagamensis]|uniref:N-methylhydantoinase A n=1 Tax=Shimia sagamensis TaxID=1566352 RepID=A0ABY1NIX1_9RHOB|nr:hydantoinase/oxoprolinase family protein [Shimia sagamensis]SMP10176.1 N-methylhydantoinase A [Shimia sagamensis]